jgi:hypothetical protein
MALETNIFKDVKTQDQHNDLLMGEIKTLKQTIAKGEERVNRLEKENKVMALVMKKVLDKIAVLNRDVIQVGESQSDLSRVHADVSQSRSGLLSTRLGTVPLRTHSTSCQMHVRQLPS